MPTVDASKVANTIANTVDNTDKKANSAEFIKKYGNEAKVYFSLRQAGWTHKGTCGVMGNIKQESDFRVNATSFDGFGSVGICQWTFGRKTKLKNFLKSHGYSMDSIQGQCEYLVKETKEEYKNVNALLVKEVSQSVEYICDYFCDKWERPAAWAANKERRRKYAKIYFDRYNGTSGNYVEDGSGSGTSGTAFDFNTTTKKLSSSNNFQYLEEQKKEESETEKLGKSIRDEFKKAYADLANLKDNNSKPHTEAVVELYNIPSSKRPNASTFGGNVHGSTLPVYSTLVEAPFAELTIGGVTFGTYQKSSIKKYPNYIQSVEATKTNGSINSYKIELIHQVAPGDNPNYIAELLSTNGFEKIRLTYGDGASGTYFRDVEALLTNVNTSFDFVNNLIRYSLEATSLSYLTATTRMNFAETTSKPSTVIMNLLKNKTAAITDYFSGMEDVNKVAELGLIPTNDAEVKIEAVKNKNIIEYLTYLTSLMTNENKQIAENSTYYLTINDEQYQGVGNTFSIKEVVSSNMKVDSLVYEVDLGYPDNNKVFDFSITSNYAWAAAMKTSSKLTSYRYDINNSGKVIKSDGSPIIKNDLNSNAYTIDNNTWKQLTRFPITANLTVKGLMAPILLLTYIKINNYYFGSKRITSGLYIVTEQKDTISGNGCRSMLGLTRVAGDDESITVDGRVRT